jgi:Fe-Mn family superoxide dismutase
MFKLPSMPYSFDALEPYIDKETMEIHYYRHHQKYIDELNQALNKHPELKNKSIEEILSNLDIIPKDIKTTIINNGGGTYNHNLFWPMMTPKSTKEPIGKIKDEINKVFKSFQNFQNEFNQAAKSRFGSGWAWLVINQAGNLEIVSTPNQNNPISDKNYVVLGLDVWEHAYYLKYQWKRIDYIEAWWNVVNWEYVDERFQK